MRKVFLACVVAMAPFAAFAGGGTIGAGAVDASSVQVGRTFGGANDQRVYSGISTGGNGGVIGAVSGNVLSGLQTSSFSVAGPAGPYTEHMNIGGAASRHH